MAGLIASESVLLALLGGLVGALLTFPVVNAFGASMGTLFPVFQVAPMTTAVQLGLAVMVGVAAALVPAWRSSRVSIVEGLRAI